MSSLVNAGERSVAGKMTRSGFVTRKSRPPASTTVASDKGRPAYARASGPRLRPLVRRGGGRHVARVRVAGAQEEEPAGGEGAEEQQEGDLEAPRGARRHDRVRSHRRLLGRDAR